MRPPYIVKALLTAHSIRCPSTEAGFGDEIHADKEILAGIRLRKVVALRKGLGEGPPPADLAQALLCGTPRYLGYLIYIFFHLIFFVPRCGPLIHLLWGCAPPYVGPAVAGILGGRSTLLPCLYPLHVEGSEIAVY